MKLKLENFQRHKDSTIEIGADEHIIALVGKSDHGKSTIERALRWFVTNRPLGNAFIRKGTSRAVVSIDGISHIKNKTKGHYEIDGVAHDTATGVPSEVYEVLGLDEVNIQRQHTKPFLLDETAGEVAKQLAKLIDLTKPQTLLKSIKSKGTKLEQKRIIQLGILNKYEGELTEFMPLNKHKRTLSLIAARMAAIEKTSGALDTLAITIENAVEVQKRLNEMPLVANHIVNAVNLLHTMVEAETKDKNLEYIRISVQDASKCDSQRMPDFSNMLTTSNELLYSVSTGISEHRYLGSLQIVMKKLRVLNLAIRKFNGYETLNLKCNSLADEHSTVVSIKLAIKNVNTFKDSLQGAAEQATRASEDLDKLKKELGMCPLCGNTI